MCLELDWTEAVAYCLAMPLFRSTLTRHRAQFKAVIALFVIAAVAAMATLAGFVLLSLWHRV